MPKLILVRHGQASFGADDYDRLSPLGEQQAVMASTEIERRGVAVTRLVAGSLLRQQQTAAPIASSAGLVVETDPRWNEYDSADLLTAHSSSALRMDGVAGISSRSFQVILEDGISAWAGAGASSPAAESWVQFRGRIDAALQETAEALRSGETAVISTSGGVIAAVCSTLLGADLRTFLALNRAAVNGAITTVLAGRSGRTLLSFNDHAHLLGAGDGLVTFR